MARVHVWQYLLNEEGQPVENASIGLSLAGTSTSAYIFLSEYGGTATTTTLDSPTVTTNSEGYFEFWMAGVSETGGYSSDQKFKLEWKKTGITQGYIDYFDIYPPISAFPEEVDETDTDTTKDKLISNALTKTFNDHVYSENLSGASSVHGLQPVDYTSTNNDYNKVVSNALLKTIMDALGASGPVPYVYTTTISSWTLSGAIYIEDITHSLATSIVFVTCYDNATKHQVQPSDVILIDNNNLRIVADNNDNLDVLIMG